MKKIIEPYYVITWDFNRDQIEKYNIMDYLISCYKETKKSKKLKTPETFEECKKFILANKIKVNIFKINFYLFVHFHKENNKLNKLKNYKNYKY